MLSFIDGERGRVNTEEEASSGPMGPRIPDGEASWTCTSALLVDLDICRAMLTRCADLREENTQQQGSQHKDAGEGPRAL